MEQYARPHRGGLWKGVGALALAGTIGAGGYVLGRHSAASNLEEKAFELPPAAGMADILPSTAEQKYWTGLVFAVRANAQGERVTYLQDPRTKQELQIPDNVWLLINADQGAGRYVMSGTAAGYTAARSIPGIFMDVGGPRQIPAAKGQ